MARPRDQGGEFPRVEYESTLRLFKFNLKFS